VLTAIHGGDFFLTPIMQADNKLPINWTIECYRDGYLPLMNWSTTVLAIVNPLSGHSLDLGHLIVQIFPIRSVWIGPRTEKMRTSVWVGGLPAVQPKKQSTAHLLPHPAPHTPLLPLAGAAPHLLPGGRRGPSHLFPSSACCASPPASNTSRRLHHLTVNATTPYPLARSGAWLDDLQALATGQARARNSGEIRLGRRLRGRRQKWEERGGG
jgi:hypothetical protein